MDIAQANIVDATLRDELHQLLEDLSAGKILERDVLIDVLMRTEEALSMTIKISIDGKQLAKMMVNSDVLPPTIEEMKLRREGTPVRFRAKNWGHFHGCKRCGERDVTDGDWIVKIFGLGWWHDNCYRIVNSDFYRGGL